MLWTGTEHALLWYDDRDYPPEGPGTLYFTRVDRDLNRVSADIRVPDTRSAQWSSAIAWWPLHGLRERPAKVRRLNTMLHLQSTARTSMSILPR